MTSGSMRVYSIGWMNIYFCIIGSIFSGNDSKWCILISLLYPLWFNQLDHAGLYEICQNYGVPWIICKSITDWADGDKDERWHNFGAVVSASYVEHVLKKFCIPGEVPGKLFTYSLVFRKFTDAVTKEDATEARYPAIKGLSPLNNLRFA